MVMSGVRAQRSVRAVIAPTYRRGIRAHSSAADHDWFVFLEPLRGKTPSWVQLLDNGQQMRCRLCAAAVENGLVGRPIEKHRTRWIDGVQAVPHNSNRARHAIVVHNHPDWYNASEFHQNAVMLLPRSKFDLYCDLLGLAQSTREKVVSSRSLPLRKWFPRDSSIPTKIRCGLYGIAGFGLSTL